MASDPTYHSLPPLLDALAQQNKSLLAAQRQVEVLAEKRRRTVVALRAQGVTIKTIADVLGVSEPAVHHLLRRANGRQ